MFPSFHTLSSLFVHFARPSFLALRGKLLSFSFFLPHYPWLLSYINPAPVDWVPQGVFFFFLFFSPLVRGLGVTQLPLV